MRVKRSASTKLANSRTHPPLTPHINIHFNSLTMKTHTQLSMTVCHTQYLKIVGTRLAFNCAHEHCSLLISDWIMRRQGQQVAGRVRGRWGLWGMAVTGWSITITVWWQWTKKDRATEPIWLLKGWDEKWRFWGRQIRQNTPLSSSLFEFLLLPMSFYVTLRNIWNRSSGLERFPE